MTTQQLASDPVKQSLGRGTAGQVLLHIEQARAGQNGWARAHEQVIRMTRLPVSANIESSLFEGAPAVAYVLAAAEQAAYEAVLTTLDRYIDELTRERLRHANQRVGSGSLPELREFDLISGLTGLGLYQLRRRSGGDILDEVLQYLVRLCQPVTVGGRTLPGWWTGHDTADHPSEYWPGGHGNLGIAHGISGPLAFMALTARRGIDVPGQLEAIETICSWLDHWQQCDGKATWWPGTITRREFKSDHLNQPGPQRPSWCYGTPGIARALQLAGIALSDQARQLRAEAALLRCITDAAQLAQLSDASLCHGWSGLVLATLRAAADADADSPLASALPSLIERLDDVVRADQSPRRMELLEGSAGVQLTQISAASTIESVSTWDACLLLSG